VETAFVLGGGGVLGAHEIGMLRALSQAGIRPDLVVGTSALFMSLGLWIASGFGGRLYTEPYQSRDYAIMR
jgi:NTE family protein